RSRDEGVGGRTPLLDITRQQACALEQALGSGYRVFVGMKHWHPYIAEAVAEMEAAGIERAVGLALAPHYSALSVGAYMEAVRSDIPFRFVKSWHLQPAYLEALAGHVRKATQGFEAETIVFTAHSLPRRI